jgi:hypothetical protein
MRLDLTLLTAIAAFTVGLLALWANPARAVNRVFGTLSLHVIVWLLCLRGAFLSENGLYWVRWASAIGGFIPLHLWIIKEVIIGRGYRAILLQAKFIALFGFSLLFSAICFSYWFVPASSTAENPTVGLGYYTYTAALLAVYALLSKEVLAEIRNRSGVSRLELQMFLLGGCFAAGAIVLLMGLRAIAGGEVKIRIQPILVLMVYGATIVGITTHKIFDARQIVLVFTEKALLVAATAAVAFFVDSALAPIMPRVLSLVFTTALALWFAAELGRWLDHKFHF